MLLARLNPWKGVGVLPRGVWVLSLTVLINRLGTMVLPFLLLYLTEHLGFEARAAALVLTCFGVGSIVAAPLAGRLADRIGSLAIMRASLFLTAAILFAFPWFSGFGAVVPCAVLFSVVSESYRPASMALFTELVPTELRKAAYSVNRLAINLGMSVGPALGGFIADRSFDALFWVDGGTALAAGVVLALVPLGAAAADRSRTETLPLPPGPGGSVLVVLLRWTEPDGTRRSRPFVRVVDTPGLLPTEAQLLLEPTPVAGRVRATARITNATGTPLRGRLVAHLPVEHFTTPVAQPVDVPPRQTIAVPIDVQSDGPAGTTYPVYVALEFEQGGLPRAIVAGAELGIGVVAGRSKVRPLAVGATALLAAAAVVFLANRRAARRRTERDRVDGRVTHT